MPAECDVPLRPGWFYHVKEDDYVKSPDELFDLYFKSVGRSCALDLGLAPRPDGTSYHARHRHQTSDHHLGPVCPALSEIGVYLEPEQATLPAVKRDTKGWVHFDNLSPRTELRMTTDGTEPDRTSAPYTAPFNMSAGGVLK